MQISTWRLLLQSEVMPSLKIYTGLAKFIKAFGCQNNEFVFCFKVNFFYQITTLSLNNAGCNSGCSTVFTLSVIFPLFDIFTFHFRAVNRRKSTEVWPPPKYYILSQIIIIYISVCSNHQWKQDNSCFTEIFQMKSFYVWFCLIHFISYLVLTHIRVPNSFVLQVD